MSPALQSTLCIDKTFLAASSGLGRCSRVLRYRTRASLLAAFAPSSVDQLSAELRSSAAAGRVARDRTRVPGGWQRRSRLQLGALSRSAKLFFFCPFSEEVVLPQLVQKVL